MANTLFNALGKKTSDNTYTKKVEVPHYEPNVGNAPPITGLYDCTKYSKLLYNINHSNVSEEEKNFLRLAATRHIVFNYALAADYYANAGAEMQELMEQSALIILDIDDAIAKGYVTLSKNIREILERSGEIADEE